MKKIFMIAVMAVVCMTASAQKMRHGAGQITIQPMIGLSTGYLRGEEETATGTVKYENNEARTGLVVGAEGEYYTTTPWLSVSAALLYQQQGWKIKGYGADKVDFINIPVLANFYVAKGFALKIGLQPGFVVSADKGIKDDCNTFNLALPVGLSYEFKNGITLDLRGVASMTNLIKNGDNMKWYADGGMLTVGYKFELK
jgi:opacity protein-like surface antigen